MGNSFKKILVLALLFLSSMPVLFTGVLCSVVSAKEIYALRKQEMLGLAVSNGRNIENFIDVCKQEVILMANSVPFDEVIQNSETGIVNEEKMDESVAFLRKWVDSNSYYHDALLLDAKGVVIAAYQPLNLYRDLSFQPYFAGSFAENDVYISSLSDSIRVPGTKVLYIATRVAANEGKAGVLVLATTLGFYETTVGFAANEPLKSVYILDSVGTVVCSSDEKVSRSSTLGSDLDNLVEKHKKNLIPGSGTKYSELDHGKKLIAYHSLNDLGWVLIVCISFWEAVEPAIVVAGVMCLFLTVTIIFSLWIALRLAKIMNEPMADLLNVFTIAERENRYIACKIRGNDEFAKLGAGYNTMIERLQSSFYELDKAYTELKERDERLNENYILLKQEQEKTKYLAFHDPMTGITNKTFFVNELHEYIEHGEQGAVFFIDLDGFKEINDDNGHEFGDRCLIDLAARLTDERLKFDLVSRIGGDEFLVMKTGSRPEIEQVLEQMKNVFITPFAVSTRSYLLSASIGVSVFPEDGDSVPMLIKKADIAMYESKHRGKNQYCFFSETLMEKLNMQNQYLENLRIAVMSEEVYPMFQPEIDISTGVIRAFEALARIKSSKLGIMSSYEFISLAETTGLIIPMGLKIMESAFFFAKRAIALGKEMQVIAINISAVQLKDPNFVHSIFELLDKVELNPIHLQIEIAESVFMKISPDNVEKLIALRSRGVSIALDDFGSGHYSFNLLAEFPIDVLKVDRVLLKEITTNIKKQTVYKSIIDLAHSLGIKVVAEGIETVEEFKLLSEMKCDSYYGYLFSKPVSETEAARLIGR